MQTPIIERVKQALNCKTNRELSAKLGIHETQVTRWRRDGFHRSTEKLINLLIDEIEKD